MNLQGIDSLKMRASTFQPGASSIDIRLDSPDGTVIGTLPFEDNSSKPMNFAQYPVSLQKVDGVHDIYFVVASKTNQGKKTSQTPIADVNWIEFNAGAKSKAAERPMLVVDKPRSRSIADWADTKLPVQDGLAVWFDASKDKIPRPTDSKNLTEQEKADFAKLALRRDASGNQSDAHQPDPTLVPESVTRYPKQTRLFNGRSQYFAFETDHLDLNHCTVVFYGRLLSNQGGSRALFIAAPKGELDFEKGFRLDFGVDKSIDRITQIHGVGAGVVENSNSLKSSILLDTKTSLFATLDQESVSIFVNNRFQTKQKRTHVESMQPLEWMLGARKIVNAKGEFEPVGFFDGECFEFLVFNRVLNAEEQTQLDTYFSSKYAGVVDVAKSVAKQARGSVPLVLAKDPPKIQPLVPGFAVKRMPVELTNLNFLQYRPDGILVAGA